MNYQDLLQCLKGVGSLDLNALVLPIEGSDYVLQPISCRSGSIDPATVLMLTEGRNRNPASFLTSFEATPERTMDWLEDVVGPDASRILFSIKSLSSGSLYGYMGLAGRDEQRCRVEVDAVVRYSNEPKPGLMRLALLGLIQWARQSLAIKEVWLRVLSGNPAIGFYMRCGFVSTSEVPLYEVRNSSDQLEALVELSPSGENVVSVEKLTWMRFQLPIDKVSQFPKLTRHCGPTT